MRRISKALGLLLLLALSAASARRMPSDADLPRPPAGGDSYPAPADDFVLPYDEPAADPDDWVLPADDDPVPPFEPTPDDDPADFHVPDTPAYPDAPAEDVVPDAPADEPVPVGGIIRDISATLHVSLPHALPLTPCLPLLNNSGWRCCRGAWALRSVTACRALPTLLLLAAPSCAQWYTPLALSYSSTKWGTDGKGNQKGHWDQQPGEVAAGSQGAVSGVVKSTTKTTDIE